MRNLDGMNLRNKTHHANHVDWAAMSIHKSNDGGDDLPTKSSMPGWWDEWTSRRRRSALALASGGREWLSLSRW